MMILLITLLPIFTLSAEAPIIYQQGIASWYAGEFQGRLTANGEIFDTNKISAAHKVLPFGTIVRVTNLTNDLQVDVRINDRGPYVGERIIDLSKAAAAKIDMVKRGISNVTLEIIYLPEIPESAYDRAEDAEYIKIQVGAFSTVVSALKVYEQLQALELKAYAEVTENRLIRIYARWITQEEASQVRIILEEAGFTGTIAFPDVTDLS